MDCFSKCTKKPCVLFHATSTRPPKFGSADFSRSCVTGWCSTEHLLHEDWIPYRVSLLGNYGTDLTLKREINRFLLAEDPYGTVAFVRFGLQRGELLRDLDQEMMVSILDWTMERFQDALLTEELDPGLFRRQGDPQEKKEARINQFLDVLKRAIGAELTLIDGHMKPNVSQEILASYDDKARLARRLHYSCALVCRCADCGA